MEIKVKINGEFKTFKQTTVNFKTMYMALEWQDMVTKQQQALLAQIKSAIDVEVEADEVEEEPEFDPYKDLRFTTDLVVSFFDGQFTHDEFISGAYFNNISEFYQLGADIFEVVYKQKETTEGKSKKKRPQLKPTS